MKVRVALVVACTLAIPAAGCAKGPILHHYDGGVRPLSEVAMVQLPINLEVLRINGAAPRFPFTRPAQVQFPPGPHNFQVRFADAGAWAAGGPILLHADAVTVPLMLEAGHTYEFKVVAGGKTWHPRVVDKTAGMAVFPRK